MLADKRYCYPLTITPFASRYLLCCDDSPITGSRILSARAPHARPSRTTGTVHSASR